jgi:hypothetical protein
VFKSSFASPLALSLKITGTVKVLAISAFSLTLGNLGGCRYSASRTYTCLETPALVAPRDTFDLDSYSLPDALPAQYHVPFAIVRQVLSGAYAVGQWLEDSTYTRHVYYAKSRLFSHSPRAACHTIIHSSADDFVGLFLVLRAADGHYFNLYLAGCFGSSGSSEGIFYSAPVTTGYILSDSVVVTKKGCSADAFRASGKHSYTDTVVSTYHIDYQRRQFLLQKRDSSRTPVEGSFD